MAKTQPLVGRFRGTEPLGGAGPEFGFQVSEGCPGQREPKAPVCSNDRGRNVRRPAGGRPCQGVHGRDAIRGCCNEMTSNFHRQRCFVCWLLCHLRHDGKASEDEQLGDKGGTAKRLRRKQTVTACTRPAGTASVGGWGPGGVDASRQWRSGWCRHRKVGGGVCV